MDAQLTLSEKQLLDRFLKSVKDTKSSSVFSYIYSGTISILGFIFFAVAAIITLKNPIDRVVYWVFFPGAIGGVGTILFGFFLLKVFKKSEEKKKMATIIEKLLN